MIPAFVRTLLAVLLVSLLVAIVVSPYIDLPLTTLPARQPTGTLVAALALCLIVVSLGSTLIIPGRLRANIAMPVTIDVHMLPLTCALLC